MSSFEELEARFIRIKDLAKNMNKDDLPSYDRTEKTTFDEVDTCCYKTIQVIFKKFLLKQMSLDDAGDEIEKLKLGYIRNKQEKHSKAVSYHELDVIRQKTGQCTRELICYEGKSQKEIFELIFCCLIPALTNKVAAEKIKEGAGYFLLTGENNLTEEEKKTNY